MSRKVAEEMLPRLRRQYAKAGPGFKCQILDQGESGDRSFVVAATRPQTIDLSLMKERVGGLNGAWFG